MKKIMYVKPHMEIVRLKSRPQLLEASPTRTVSTVRTNLGDDDFDYEEGADRQGR